ncbi:MAG: RNA 3'-terminal phosphate cyclase [Candidatus Hydrothermarchaeales archaeon]
MIHIDGSYGEGGGQILRSSIALSSLLGEPIRIDNIRVNRPKPGLAQQHLTGIEAMQRLTDAEIKGLKLGSTEVEFSPSSLHGGSYSIDIGTAGSISLVLQVVSLPCAFTDSAVELNIIGGTDVAWSPPIDYMKEVFYPSISKMGCRTNLEILKRGYYPRGGGRVNVRISPMKRLMPLDLTERGKFLKVMGVAHSLNLPEHIVKREAKAAKRVLKDYSCHISLEYGRGTSTGTGIVLWAFFENSILCASSLGKPGKPAEKVGEEAARSLLNEIEANASIDLHLGDQIIPYLALAEGESRIFVGELTNHLKTNIYVVEKILNTKFKILTHERGYTITVDGIGFEKR